MSSQKWNDNLFRFVKTEVEPRSSDGFANIKQRAGVAWLILVLVDYKYLNSCFYKLVVFDRWRRRDEIRYSSLSPTSG